MEYISYNMGTRDFPDIYARALGLGHIYQANPSCPWYNYYIYISLLVVSVATAIRLDSYAAAYMHMYYSYQIIHVYREF